MDLLGALGILVRVVETGSFSAVARERELSQAAVVRPGLAAGGPFRVPPPPPSPHHSQAQPER